jgi:hypothetical protein
MSNTNGAIHLDEETAGRERKLGELFADLSRDFSTLMRQEMELAKAELREEASKAGRAGGMLGAAAVAGLLTLFLLAWAAAWGLSEIVPEGVAFLIVGVVVGIVALSLFLAGKKQLANIRAVPDETVETLKEDVQWAKAQLK